MLIQFTVENFLSFKEPATFSMLASNERIHPEHVVRGKGRNQPKLLRLAAIYGANASGKSNLVKALKFLQTLVVEGVSAGARIPLKRFRLDPEWRKKPATFSMQFRVTNINYMYKCVLNPESVVSEQLFTMTNTTEKLLFSRITDNNQTKVEFGTSLKLSKKDSEFLDFVARGTRPNQLFLHETIDHNIEYFRSAFLWFVDTLQIIQPNMRFALLEKHLDNNKNLQDFFGKVLQIAGTGINSVRTEEVSSDVLPHDFLELAESALSLTKILFVKSSEGHRFTLTKDDDQIKVFKTLTIHRASTDEEIAFEIFEESDGTQRLFDFIPMLYQLANSPHDKVFIIDEINRSLHPHLTKMIIDIHLDANNRNKPIQLIITTHETNLLDLDILRRDEIWFIEKNENNSTNLYSLADFELRYDKTIETDYLVGRYGAIPLIGSLDQLTMDVDG